MATATRTIQRLRNFLMGKEYQVQLRYAPDVATRSIPAPNLPVGAAHALSANYYVSRDSRREHAPPTVAAVHNAQLTSGEEGESPPAERKVASPGDVYNP